MHNMTNELELYKAKLKAQDWYYMYSDDFRAFSEGQQKSFQLRDLQRRLDPNGTIWNQFAPADCRIK